MSRESKISELVRLVSNKDKDPAPDEALFETGFLDSFDLPELVSELEKTFNMRVPDSDLRPRNFSTVQKIETYLQGKGV